MKKVIVFSLVLAMAVGSAFAADFGGTVFAGVRVLAGDNDKVANDDGVEIPTDLSYGAGISRARIEGAGESDDGTFGGWLRVDAGRYAGSTIPSENGYNVAAFSALAWWQPMEMLKMTIGGNPDGFYEKGGYARWMFYQMPSDVGIVQAGNAWGGGYIPMTSFSAAFFPGVENGLMFDITPADMFAVHLYFPYFKNHESYWPRNKLIDVFKGTMVQFDINLDGIGNIALTFQGQDPWTYHEDGYEMDDGAGGTIEIPGFDGGANPDGIGAKFWLYFRLSAVDNLALDLGIGLKLPEKMFPDDFKVTRNHPIDIGLAAKMDVTDSFGFKARILAELGGEVKPEKGDSIKDPFILGLDLLPYIGLSDNMKLFIGLGLTMVDFPKVEGQDKPDSLIGWHFNPYLQVGAEWGPTFYVGLRIWSDGVEKVTPEKGDKYKTVNFEVPIGIQVSF
jgi:hypothetical protein